MARHLAGSGYCQSNRLLFTDYRAQCYWFIVVEMAMCVLCGLLDGIKLGLGRCNFVLVAASVLFGGYLFLVLYLRPHNAWFALLFTCCMTILQLLSIVLMTVNQFVGVDSAASWAETAQISLYLILVRTAIDILPHSYKLFKMIRRIRR